MYPHCGNCANQRWIEDTYDDGTYIESYWCVEDHHVYREVGYNCDPCEDYKENVERLKNNAID